MEDNDAFFAWYKTVYPQGLSDPRAEFNRLMASIAAWNAGIQAMKVTVEENAKMSRFACVHQAGVDDVCLMTKSAQDKLQTQVTQSVPPPSRLRPPPPMPEMVVYEPFRKLRPLNSKSPYNSGS